MLVIHSLGVRVDFVYVDAGVRLLVVDIAVESGWFRVVAVHAPNDQTERISFFRRLGPFPMNPCG